MREVGRRALSALSVPGNVVQFSRVYLQFTSAIGMTPEVV